jgi:hypothetical protein
VVNEARERYSASESYTESIRQTLQQRVNERLALLNSLSQSNHLYRSGLLIQSEATVNSTLAQFRVGNTGFVSVLEAISGYLSDYEGFLQSIAQAQRVAIAQAAVSLDPISVETGSGIPAISTPSGGAGSSMSGTSAQSNTAPTTPGAKSGGMSGM